MTSSTDIPVRRRRTRKQWHQLLKLFHQSQLPRKEFADQHGVGLSTISKWLQRERLAGNPPVNFQEVVLPTPTTSWAVEVVSPHGWVIRLPHSAEVPTLPQLLRALPC